MADTLSSLSIVAFIFAGLFFAGAIVLFIVLKIPEVIDYFSNRSAKKSVQKMVSTGGSSSKAASFHTSPTNRERGKLTEPVAVPEPRKVRQAVKPPAAQKPVPNAHPETGLLSADHDDAPTGLDTTEELVVNLASETELLDAGATTVLQETIANVAATRPHVVMTPIEEIVLTHTSEDIP